jgi:hypothetical protein
MESWIKQGDEKKEGKGDRGKVIRRSWKAVGRAGAAR